ncbi:phage antirepressor KilAC domain-containing protein [Paenibacillus sedimenti]|uniref:Phage antirepressor KilAC domain-containing protein n=1 Tax=Paenibacillus sedimenti TaxID=2770274 RepID=A0A926KPS3_9BACL|nr:phage antirepressor KilAC domain-containing protein [Paenibacillus sedimenti]MBD0381247.1 phage antirepressor KilAC domain-containing protein [Paenibacillus sedimenti]
MTQIFNFNGAQLRMIEKDGQPWFVAKDVCDILEISNPTVAIQRLDADEVTKFNLGGLHGETNIVNEYGLYSLVLGSRKPEAKAFKRWVTHEVLPSIRKHGMYAREELLDNPDLLIQVATKLKEERAAKALLEQKIEADRPKVIFADAVTASKSSILIGELAKILKQNGVDTGQNRLFTWLRDNSYLISRKGTDFNMPTQYSMELGLFEIKETSVSHSDGHITISKTPKVTGKGQLYFINKLKQA